jgi:protein-disulfide isomerase
MIPSAPTEEPEPVVLEDWESELNTGIVIGPADAPIQIVELMDFQCPYCAGWSALVDSFLTEHPDAARVSFHHWPLPNHPHALAAAVASECADRQGAFAEFTRVVFANQSSIGQWPWSTFAERAGVNDLPSYEACAAMPADSFPRIQYGLDLAERTGATGTPTVWINGQHRRPTLRELRRLVH